MTSKSVLSRKAQPLLCIPLLLAMYSACSAPDPTLDEGNVNASAFALGANACMDDMFPGTLNCSANDVRIARAINPSEVTCEKGSEVVFNADFEVVAGATRFDVGIYLASDGDPNGDGAMSGQCAVTKLPSSPAPFVNFDPMPDTCGDIQGGATQLVNLAVNTLCVDEDGDGFLNLPYCTSWRQPGSNTVCDGVEDVFPGSPSKCRCDRTFNVPIRVKEPLPTVNITKSAIGIASVVVRYAVDVQNTSNKALTLDSLLDDKFGNIRVLGGAVQATNCGGITTVAAGATAHCEFDAEIDLDLNPLPHENVITGTLHDADNNFVTDSDDASVMSVTMSAQ